MCRDSSADTWAVAVDEVESSRRQSGFGDNLGENAGTDRRHLAWLQHHGTTRGDSRCHLAADLIQRPVPRRDESADADGLLDDTGIATGFLEYVVAQNLAGGCEVADTGANLCGAGEGDRCAHLAGDRHCQFFGTGLDAGDYPVEYGDTLCNAALRPQRKRGTGSRDGAIHIAGIAHADIGVDFFGRGIDDVMDGSGAGSQPFAIDIELQTVNCHEECSWSKIGCK